jgi:hypothetical protein
VSNGIMVAALLQLHRRPAVIVITACFAINLASTRSAAIPESFSGSTPCSTRAKPFSSRSRPGASAGPPSTCVDPGG